MSFVKTAYDLARKQVFFCRTTDKLSRVAERMHKKNIGSILVKKGDVLKGIITVNDILRQISSKRLSKDTLAKDVMSSPVIVVNKDLEVDDLVDEFNKHKVSRMVLINKKNEIVGVVRDIAAYKYLTFFKYDREARERFSKNYLRELY